MTGPRMPPERALVAAAERLVRALESENAALAAHDEAQVAALLAEKQAACAAFADHVRGLAEAGASAASGSSRPLPSLPPALEERLRRAASENERRLSAGIAARKRFLDLIAAAVRQQNAGAGTYARSGALAGGGRRGTAAAPSALSFDRSL